MRRQSIRLLIWRATSTGSLANRIRNADKNWAWNGSVGEDCLEDATGLQGFDLSRRQLLRKLVIGAAAAGIGGADNCFDGRADACECLQWLAFRVSLLEQCAVCIRIL